MCQSIHKLNTRLMAIVMAAVTIFCAIPAAQAAETEGTCGVGLTWSFADGTLTIAGSGAISDYAKPEDIPWYSFREQILRLSLPDGLTRIGNMAFYDCYNLTSVVIPSTVREIGELAFCQCTSMTILQLNRGLQTIGRSAFELCSALQDLRLPDTVTTLGRHAFYRCASIQYVTVPASVTEMGSGVFAYCDGLIRAEVYAPLTQLPRWTFYGCTRLTSISLNAETKGLGNYCVYGCESLSVVYYGGEAGDSEVLREQITEDKADFGQFGWITDGDAGNSEITSEVGTDSNGDLIVENTTVTQTDEATVSISTSTNVTDSTAETRPTGITATVVDENGWDQVLNAVQSATADGQVDVNVYVAGDADIPQSVTDALAGKNVTMSVQSGSGSSYALDFSVISKSAEEAASKLDLSYMLFSLESADYPELAGVQVYRLTFNSSSAVPAEVMIQLPIEISQKDATLYQIDEGNTLTSLQSVVTDRSGVAHFYLGAVDSETEYLIGINVPGVTLENAIVPDSLQADYGVTDNLANVEYVITGRTSSWGMSIGQVSWILAAVMVVCVVGVGVFMFALNKRKLRQGYVPDLGEDEEEI